MLNTHKIKTSGLMPGKEYSTGKRSLYYFDHSLYPSIHQQRPMANSRYRWKNP